jgi:hypothetical protein
MKTPEQGIAPQDLSLIRIPGRVGFALALTAFLSIGLP